MKVPFHDVSASLYSESLKVEILMADVTGMLCGISSPPGDDVRRNPFLSSGIEGRRLCILLRLAT
jgi:hypothetical protein